MKSKKILAAVAVLVLLIGGYGAVRYVENAVVRKVRELERLPSPKVRIGDAQFSLLRKQLVLNDLQVEVKTVGSAGISSTSNYAVRRVEAVLPLELLFDAPAGQRLLCSEAVAHDMRVESVIGAEKDDDKIRVTQIVAEQRIANLRANLPKLAEVMRTDASEAKKFLDITAEIRCDLWEVRNIRAEMDGIGAFPSIAYTLELGRVEGFDKGDMKLGEYSGLKVFAKNAPVASLGAMSFRDFRMPTPAVFEALDQLGPNSSEEEARAALRGLFSGPAPLIGQVAFKDFKLTMPLLPLSLDSLVIDCASAAPLDLTYAMDNLSFPTRLLLLKAPQLKLPDLPMLHIDAKGSTRTVDGTMRDRQMLAVRDVAVLSTDISLRDTPSLFLDAAPEQLLGIKIVHAEATLEDKRLLAYVGGNLNPSGTGVARMLQQIAAVTLSQYFTPQQAVPLLARINAFVEQPGTLKISFAPKRPMPVLQLINPAAVGEALTVAATPGSAPLEQQIRRLFAPGSN